MPTVPRIGPDRVFFYSSDCAEPPQIHVGRDTHVAKFWLDPVRLQRNGGFSAIEINRIQKLIQENGMFHKQPKVGNSSMSKRLEKQKRQKGQKSQKGAFLRLLPFLPFLFPRVSPRNCYLGDETCQENEDELLRSWNEDCHG